MYSTTSDGISIDSTCAEGADANLDCQIESVSRLTVQWLKDNVKIPYSTRIEASSDNDSHSLVIREVYPEDAGKYLVLKP